MSHRRRWRKATVRGVACLVLAELVLQIVRPEALDNIRNYTFAVQPTDVRYITMQWHNFDPKTQRPMLVYDAEVFWRATPGAEGTFFQTPHTVINQLGLREAPLRAVKAPAERRILFFGDSATFGIGVEAGERYSDLVGSELLRRGSGPTWRTINAGMAGYSTFQGLAWMQRIWDDIDPDVVVFAFGVNDAVLSRFTDLEFQRATLSTYATSRALLRRSQVLCAVDGLVAYARRGMSAWRTGKRRAVANYLYYPSPPKRAEKVSRVPMHEFIANLSAARAFCAERGATFIVMDQFVTPGFSFIEEKDPQYFERFAARTAELHAFVTREGIPFVAVGAAFERAALPVDELMVDFCHPSPPGHALIAAAVLDVLESTRMLPVDGLR